MIYRFIFAVALCFFSAPRVFAYNTPELGDSSISVLSPTQEKEYGKLFMRAIEQEGVISNDQISTQYIQDLGYKLAGYSGNPSKRLYFFIVKDSSINAFAGPDGNIGINTGLIQYASNEDELAAVIAHEISHVTQNHLARSIQDGKKRAIPSIFAILASMATGNPDVAVGVINATVAGNIQASINHTREQEQEADHLGFNTLAKAGFDSHGMASLFKKMQRDQYGKADNYIAFLNTHPSYSTRVADAENRSAQYPAVPPRNALRFYLVQARLFVSANNNNSAATLNTYQTVFNKAPSETHRYAYALALANNGQFSESERQMRQLISDNPDEIIYPLTLAEIFQSAGAYDKAIATLSVTKQLYPSNFPLIMLYGNLLIQNKQYRDAVLFLKPNYPELKDNRDFLGVYSDALGKNQNLILAYQIRSQAYLLNDNLQAAISQLEVALKQPEITKYDREAIEAQLKELKIQLDDSKKRRARIF